jgi:hypothetical protein
MRTTCPRDAFDSLLLAMVGLGLAFALVGCSTAAGPNATARPAADPSLAAPGAALPPASTAPANATPEAMLLVGRLGEPGLRLLIAQTGEAVMDLPAGTPDAAWKRMVTATADGSKTQVRDILLDGGLPGPRLDIDGQWRLPTIGFDPVPAGVSADGSTIALVPDASGSTGAAGTSRFAIVQHANGNRPTTSRDAQLRLAKTIELKGAFDFDALSPSGDVLYVVEHLDGQTGSYQVRAVDVATGYLRDQVIADKRNIGEAMAGWPIAQLRRPDGIVLTLYRGAEHPFVHALNTAEAWAVCLDLPANGASDAVAARDWGLAPSADGKTVYAINANLGLAAEINPSELTVTRTSRLETASARSGSSIVLAKFGHEAVGPAGRVLVSPDGGVVWAAGANGILEIDTRDLSVRHRFLEGTAVDGIAVAPDGSVLFALVRDGGRIVALLPGSGREAGTVPGGGFDRLLAAAPW